MLRHNILYDYSNVNLLAIGIIYLFKRKMNR